MANVRTPTSSESKHAQGSVEELAVDTTSLPLAHATPTPSTEDHTATTFSVSNQEQSRALERDQQATPELTQSEDAPQIPATRATSSSVSLVQLSSSIASASSGSLDATAPRPRASDENDDLDPPIAGIPSPPTAPLAQPASIAQPPTAEIDETDRDLEAGPSTSTSSPVDEVAPST